jgi:hypothetical protein
MRIICTIMMATTSSCRSRSVYGSNKFDGMMHELMVGLAWGCRSIKNGKPLFESDFIPETGPVPHEIEDPPP